MEPKEVLPEYVLQPHVISRAAYSLSANAKKMMAMCMSIIRLNISNLTVTFSVFDFCQALGLERGGKTYTLIKEAIKELVKSEISIQREEEFICFSWIDEGRINERTNIITIKLSEALYKNICLEELIKMYARIELKDFGKLKSFYAMRYLEIAKSYEYFAGKNGNKSNSWFFELTVEELRRILGVEKGEYLITNNLRIKAIERPIKELNESNLGLKMTLDYIRRGRFLVSVRFKCEKIPIKLENRKKKECGGPAVIAPPESPIADHSLGEKELERIKTLYPDEYAERYAKVLAAPPNKFMRDTPHLWEIQAGRIACQELLEHHGIRK